jgi:DNA-binding transcriptional MerR regulator
MWAEYQQQHRLSDEEIGMLRQTGYPLEKLKEKLSDDAFGSDTQFRAEKHADAVQTLRRAEELARAEVGIPSPTQLAILAMAHHKLAHADEAKTTLSSLRDLMKSEG